MSTTATPRSQSMTTMRPGVPERHRSGTGGMPETQQVRRINGRSLPELAGAPTPRRRRCRLHVAQAHPARLLRRRGRRLHVPRLAHRRRRPRGISRSSTGAATPRRSTRWRPPKAPTWWPSRWRLSGGRRSLPAAAARGLGGARLRPGGGRSARAVEPGRSGGPPRRHPRARHHRLAGAAADRARCAAGGGADRPVLAGLRGPRRRRDRRRPADPRGAPAVPGARLRPAGRAGRVVAGRDRAAAPAGGQRDPARPRARRWWPRSRRCCARRSPGRSPTGAR